MPTSFRAPFRLTASPYFYLVHYSGFLASLFDIPSHGLQDCTTREVLARSETMAETTPLLPRADRPPHDLSISLHVCHSQWSSLIQKVLVAVRASTAAYLSVAFALDMFHETSYNQRGKQFAFEACNVSLAIQTVYYWITTVGTSPQLCINLLIF